MDWNDLERIVGESLPTCVKTFLTICGYDTLTSIQNISEKSIYDIENHLSKCEIMIDCSHAEYYKEQTKFQLLPGHRDLIHGLSKIKLVNDPSPIAHFSIILQELIKTAQQNINRQNTHPIYGDVIRYFSTYIFLLCGRSCYEVLNSNLPLPSTKTVCECYQFIFFYFFYFNIGSLPIKCDV